MKNAPIVVKRNVKRPSGVRAAGFEWIAHLHKLWAIPRSKRANELEPLHLTG